MYVLFSGEKKNEEEEKRSITELHILELFETWVSFLYLFVEGFCLFCFVFLKANHQIYKWYKLSLRQHLALEKQAPADKALQSPW